MPKHPDYPHVSSYADRYGKMRWRYRNKGVTINMPGDPGDEVFEAKYAEITGGKPPAKVVSLPAPEDATFRQAWLMIQRTHEYQALDFGTKENHKYCLISFFDLPVIEGKPLLWGDVPVAKMNADDLETIKDRLAHIPTRGARVKSLLRKIFKLARRKGWRLDDPTDLVDFKRGVSKIGHKPWPVHLLAKFEARHKIGSPARTAYSVALWFGNRREDVALLDWSQLQEVEVIDNETGEPVLIEAFVFEQAKEVQTEEDMVQVRPYSAMVREALEPIRKASGPVLVNLKGNPYSLGGLSDMMRFWCEQADIPAGYTLHGLRKTYSKELAESGASLWQQKDSLGHTTLQQVAHYGRSADKRQTTYAASKLLEQRWRRRGGGALKVVK